MRIALFSDIHSNYHALDAVLADMAGRGVDRMVCLGDVTLKGPLPKACVDRLRSLGCPVVLGNTDGCYHPDSAPARYTPRNQSQAEVIADFERHCAALTEDDRQWLQTLPVMHTVTAEGVRIDLFHAVPHSNYVLLWPWSGNEELEILRAHAETKVAGFGHNHRAFVRVVKGMVVVNSGSVGAPFDGDPRAGYAILELEQGRISTQIVRVPYDPEPAIKAAQDLGMHGWELFAHTARTGQFPG